MAVLREGQVPQVGSSCLAGFSHSRHTNDLETAQSLGITLSCLEFPSKARMRAQLSFASPVATFAPSSALLHQQRVHKWQIKPRISSLPTVAASTADQATSGSASLLDQLDSVGQRQWQEARQLLQSELGLDSAAADEVLLEAGGWRKQAYWRQQRIKLAPDPKVLSANLAYLRGLGLSAEDLASVLVEQPEVAGLSVELMQKNVATLETKWFLKGKHLSAALKRKVSRSGKETLGAREGRRRCTPRCVSPVPCSDAPLARLPVGSRECWATSSTARQKATRAAAPASAHVAGRRAKSCLGWLFHCCCPLSLSFLKRASENCNPHSAGANYNTSKLAAETDAAAAAGGEGSSERRHARGRERR